MESFQKYVPVPVLVFEDMYLSAELGAAANFPRSLPEGGQNYTFDWHPVYNAIGGKDPVLIRTLEEYQTAFDFLCYKLRDDAIIFLDLHFVEAGMSKFLIRADEITDDLFGFMKCYAGADSPEQGLAYFNPLRLGLLLAFAAARNQNWRGVITFQSNQDVVDLDHLRTCLGTGDRIQWFDLRQTLKEGGAALAERAGFVNTAINAFLAQRKGPPFWPQFTDSWFRNNENQPTHDLPFLNRDGVNEIKKYFSNLLPGFKAPEAWFNEPQREHVYNVLKGLIGAGSVSAGRTAGSGKNLTLGALPILLAAQMTWRRADIGWLASFEWDAAATYEIMKHKHIVEAQTAIRSAASFLERLAFGTDGSSQVLGSHWGNVANDESTHLLIDFDLDPLSPAGTRSLLQTLFGARWGRGSGQTITAYENMMESARTIGGRIGMPYFSLCIYPVFSKGLRRTITRLDFRAL